MHSCEAAIGNDASASSIDVAINAAVAASATDVDADDIPDISYVGADPFVSNSTVS